MGTGSWRGGLLIVRIDVGPFEGEEGLRLVVDVLKAVFHAVPVETDVPVETTIVDADTLDG